MPVNEFLHLIAIFASLFIAPLVLGGFIVAQGAHRSVVTSWFGFATAIFLLIVLVALAFVILIPV
ncbi:MAG: hypothetical protein K6U89_19875 [Chloroflexi bacterium]|nr:hypothetical protein [Chloroflexota bacterium]